MSVASYQILRWATIPTGVKASDDNGDVRKTLPIRFQHAVDAIATASGRTDTKAYLAGWTWSEAQDRAGSAEEVANAIRDELVAENTPDHVRELESRFLEELGAADSDELSSQSTARQSTSSQQRRNARQ